MDKKEIYTVISCASGEDYENDYAYVDGVFYEYEDARACYVTVKEEYSPNEDDEYEDYEADDCYEITNMTQDYHAIVRIEKTQII